MNNTLNTQTNAGVVVINNPTAYDPDRIVKRYVSIYRDTVANCINRRVANGNTHSEAAQDLFVRAVRYEESNRYQKVVCLLNCFLLIYDNLFHSGSNLLLSLLLDLIGGWVLTKIAYNIVTSITDNIGIVPQYSI